MTEEKLLPCPYNTPKFKVGDNVRIVKYGHLLWQSDGKGNISVFDMADDLIGKQGIIVEVSNPQPNLIIYAIDGIPEKHAWYDEQQLELA